MADFDKDDWLSDPDPHEIEEDDRLGSDGTFDALSQALSRVKDNIRAAQVELDRVANLPVKLDSLTKRLFTTLTGGNW